MLQIVWAACILLAGLLWVVWVLFSGDWPEEISLFVAVASLLVLGLIFLRFTQVDEGTSKQVMRLGAYKKTLLTKEGYKVEKNRDIVALGLGEKPSFYLPGGLRFVGLWPIDKIYVYDFDWIKINADGKTKDRHEKKVDFILTRDYVYGLKITEAEDFDLMPLEVLLSATAEIVNPYKALFRVKDWFRTFVGKLSPYVRQFIGEKSYDELQKTDLERKIFEALTADGIIGQLKDLYGIALKKLEVVNLNPSGDYAKITLQRLQGRRNAEQAIEETAGRVLESVAMLSGLTVDQLNTKLSTDPSLRGKSAVEGGFQEAFAFSKDLVIRDRAGEKGELEDIRVGSTHGGAFPEGAILGAIRAVFKGKKKSGVSGRGGNPKNKGGKADDFSGFAP